ncbi:Uncharacterised protein [uncultured archaeon]|nr:Uncharacterised protein [uncultured archaeon]
MVKSRTNGPSGLDTTRIKAAKAQSALEYLVTYSWAVLVIASVIAFLFLFVLAPSRLTQQACRFSFGSYCQDFIFGSNAVASSVGILLTNSQSFAILNPSIQVNVTGFPLTTSDCLPSYVLPGGAIICTVTIPQQSTQGMLVAGKLYLSAIPCQSGDAASCASNQRQNYSGAFATQVQPLIIPNVSITLSAKNATNPANGAIDPLTATVKFFGSSVSGATVSFSYVPISPNSPFATLSPAASSSDSSGHSFSGISSMTSGDVNVIASFAGQSANTIVSFRQPLYVTFQQRGISCSAENIGQTVLTVKGVPYTCAQLPATVSFVPDSCAQHPYAISQVISGPLDTRYAYNSIGGCGLTSPSGSFSVGQSCSISSECKATVVFNTQYHLSEIAYPIGAGQVTPGDSWIDALSTVQISETPNFGWAFDNWFGAGYLSYTGNAVSANIVMNGPISEQATYYVTTSTSTTSTTSLSTTTTVGPSSTTTIGPSTTSTIGTSTTSTVATSTTSMPTTTSITSGLRWCYTCLINSPGNAYAWQCQYDNNQIGDPCYVNCGCIGGARPYGSCSVIYREGTCNGPGPTVPTTVSTLSTTTIYVQYSTVSSTTSSTTTSFSSTTTVAPYIPCSCTFTGWCPLPSSNCPLYYNCDNVAGQQCSYQFHTGFGVEPCDCECLIGFASSCQQTPITTATTTTTVTSTTTICSSSMTITGRATGTALIGGAQHPIVNAQVTCYSPAGAFSTSTSIDVSSPTCINAPADPSCHNGYYTLTVPTNICTDLRLCGAHGCSFCQYDLSNVGSCGATVTANFNTGCITD